MCIGSLFYSERRDQKTRDVDFYRHFIVLIDDFAHGSGFIDSSVVAVFCVRSAPSQA